MVIISIIYIYIYICIYTTSQRHFSRSTSWNRPLRRRTSSSAAWAPGATAAPPPCAWCGAWCSPCASTWRGRWVRGVWVEYGWRWWNFDMGLIYGFMDLWIWCGLRWIWYGFDIWLIWVWWCWSHSGNFWRGEKEEDFQGLLQGHQHPIASN